MDLAILSDVHANSWALEAAIRSVRAERPRAKFCFLGDILGYGPDPLGTLQKLKQLSDQGDIYCRPSDGRAAILPGNHEELWVWLEREKPGICAQLPQLASLSPRERYDEVTWLVDREIYESFIQAHTYIAQREGIAALLLNMVQLSASADPAIQWYRSIIQPQIDPRRHTAKALVVREAEAGQWTLVLAHGTVEDPLNGLLLPCNTQDPGERQRRATANREPDQRKVLLYGHSHVPLCCWIEPFCEPRIEYHKPLRSDGPDVVIINPGSIGQPRDRDIRPCMALLNLTQESCETVFLRASVEQSRHGYFVEQLGAGHYPSKVRHWARTAESREELVGGHCEYVLRARAGQFWTTLGAL